MILQRSEGARQVAVGSPHWRMSAEMSSKEAWTMDQWLGLRFFKQETIVFLRNYMELYGCPTKLTCPFLQFSEWKHLAIFLYEHVPKIVCPTDLTASHHFPTKAGTIVGYAYFFDM